MLWLWRANKTCEAPIDGANTMKFWTLIEVCTLTTLGSPRNMAYG